MADVNGHFSGVRTGNEIRCAEEVQKFLIGEPFATMDDFVLHHGDVGGGSAKGSKAELEKKGGDGPKTFGVRGGFGHGGLHYQQSSRSIARGGDICREPVFDKSARIESREKSRDLTLSH